MRYGYDNYKSLIVADKRLTKLIFLQKAGIKPGTYAADMFSRMYDWIFSESNNLEDVFEKYYKPEYINFNDFLYKKYTLPKNIIDEIMSLKSENENYTILDVDESSSYGGFIYLVFENEMDEPYNICDKVVNLLLMR